MFSVSQFSKFKYSHPSNIAVIKRAVGLGYKMFSVDATLLKKPRCIHSKNYVRTGNFINCN